MKERSMKYLPALMLICLLAFWAFIVQRR
jgi:hypothetical protein